MSGTALVRRVLTFPPLLALVLACAWGASGLARPAGLLAPLSALAAPLVPLALIAVGAQLRLHPAVLRKRWPLLAIGLATKLLLVPALCLGLYVGLLSARGMLVRVTILEAAMAPMITASVLVSEFALDEELATLMIAIGIPISLCTVPLWNALLLRLL